MMPFLPETTKSAAGSALPKIAFEDGHDVRIFMPKWTNINERRHQLHDVIRLSGQNIIIEDIDHPLVIKVASLPATRMQVYFADSEDYLRGMTHEDLNSAAYSDNNTERAIFYARGVLETVKKLRWNAFIVHCQGWLSAFAPIYIKTNFADDPAYRDTKIVMSIFDDMDDAPLISDVARKLVMRGLTDRHLKKHEPLPTDYTSLLLFALRYADGVVLHTDKVPAEVKEYLATSQLPTARFNGEDDKSQIIDLYNKLLGYEAE